MRRKEFTSGVQVQTESGDVVGSSAIAGAMAVGACLACRVLALVPILGVPPVSSTEYLFVVMTALRF